MNFNQEEYFLIFDCFIWPQAIKLPTESIKSINNLLKIFSLWSERPKYYPLLWVKLENFDLVEPGLITNLKELNSKADKKICLMEHFKERNILDIIFELIDSAKCSQNVINYVFDMIHNLVSFADFKEEVDELRGDDIKTIKLPFNLDSVYNEFIENPSKNSVLYNINNLKLIFSFFSKMNLTWEQ